MKNQGKEQFLTKTRVAVFVLITAIIIVLGAIYQSLNSTKQTQTSEGTELGFSQGNENENQDEVEKGKVYVRYLNEEGTEIATTDVLEGEIGTQYTTTRKQIGHYVSNGYDPMNRIGDYKSEDITVVYLYKFVDNAVSVTDENNVITLNVQNVAQENEYKLILEQKNEEGENLTGGKFSMYDVEELPNKIEGTTNNGRLTLGAVTVANEKNSEIVLNEQEAPKGYLKGLKDSGASVTLLRSYNNENSSYQLSATSNDVELEVEENTEDREIILKVVNDRIKTYDLAVKKFASSIDGTATSRNIAARVDNEGNIVYDNTAATLNVRDSEKIVYTIRVYNEGNQDMAAPVIAEVLPSGLKFLPDSTINTTNGWAVENGALKTSKLVGQTIAGIDTASETTVNYLEVQLEVEVEEDNASTTSTELTNVTTIPTDEREITAENNTATETVNLVRITPTYDLAVKKFASKINGTDTGRSVTATLNNLNQIVYEENNAEKTISHGQTIEYTIRVYNEGNRDVQCTKLTDAIPAGLNFDANNATNSQYGWTKNGNNIETSSLAGQTISKVKTYRGEVPQYKEVKLVLTLDEDDVPAEETTILNTVSAAQATNETDTSDNTDTDEVNLSRTPKTYDLAVKVFASTIDGGSTSRNVTVGLNETNQIVYNEVRPAKSVKDEQRVVYTIRVFNEGTGAVNGTKLTDVVPAGLRFVEDSTINTLYGWTKNGNNVETTYLETQEIRGANLRRSEVPAYKEVKVEFEVVEEDTADEVNKITNTVRIAKVANETDELDNENSDELDLTRTPPPVEIYDLAMKKFAYSVDGQNLNKEITASINNNNQIVYANENTKTTVVTGQKIVFTLRIFNEGNQAMAGKVVTDVIPEGLQYVENSTINETYGWTVENGVATTNYLVGQTIDGFEAGNNEQPKYKDVQIECEVVAEAGVVDKEMTNIARVEAADNETDTADNQGEAIAVIRRQLPKVSDLSMKKFLYSVDGTVLSNKEVKANNVNGEIKYTQEDSSIYKVSNNQKVLFTLRVYNVGNGETLGRTVIENIPDGFKFDSDSEINTANNWKMYKKDRAGNLVETTDIKEAKVLKSEKLLNETIGGFEVEDNELPKYKDVQIEFIVDEDNVKTEDRIVTNTASVETSRIEPNSDNDTDEEKVQVKVFDLNVTKYIKEITIKNSTAEKTYPLGLDKKGHLFKAEIKKNKVDETEVLVTYGLRVKNVGEIAGYATELTDYIPADFELIETNGWKVVGDTAKTESIAKKLIQPGDYTTVEISFRWKLNENNLGLRDNVAVISASTNDYLAKDNIPDKDNNEKFIISLATGAFEISAIVILSILIATAVIITVRIRRKK